MHRHCLSDFDFALPAELIAQHPAPERSASRLLDGTGAQATDRIFRELPQLLRPGDLLIFNDTRVIKARLFGSKASGGAIELLVERVLQGGEVVAHMKTASRKPGIGTALAMDGGFSATVLGRWPGEDGPLFRIAFDGDPFALMELHGRVPLPPYIERRQRGATLSTAESVDEQRYQTVFARHPGAVAAPTAALHFDEDLLALLAKGGIRRAPVTLHVGAGTFQPVKSEDIAAHRMHTERYAIPDPTLEAIRETKQAGGRVVAIGTTTVRTLESWAHGGAASGETEIFITPGFEFRVTDLLVTNFHLPRSTLLMLVSAFAGYEHVRALYRHAIEQRYRFFSYGDAMLLKRKGLPPGP